MRQRLPRRRPIGSSLLRLTLAQVIEAKAGLNALPGDPVGAVHGARVSLKRARASLKLLGRGKSGWAPAMRRRLSAVARELATARESAVAADLAGRLQRRLRGDERRVAAQLVRSCVLLAPGNPAGLQARLEDEAERLLARDAPSVSGKRLRRRLRARLAEAEASHAAARQHGVAEVHDWRKDVVMLRDQTGLASSHWKRGAGRAHVVLIGLARRLGRAGDLSLLLQRLARLDVPADLEPARLALMGRLEEQRVRAVDLCSRGWTRRVPRLRKLLEAEPEQPAATGAPAPAASEPAGPSA